MRRHVSTALATGVIALLIACASGSPKPVHTNDAGLKTVIGDGSWVAGEEIAYGTWEAVDDITAKPDCVWFVSPAIDGPTQTPDFRQPHAEGKRVQFEIKAHESITTLSCGQWRWVK